MRRRGRGARCRPPGLEAPRCAEQERGTKEWSGEGSELGDREPPGRLPKDPGRRKSKCHLNSTQGAGSWDPSALFSNNGWSASYKLRESWPGRRTIARPLGRRSWPLETPALPRAGRGAPG